MPLENKGRSRFVLVTISFVVSLLLLAIKLYAYFLTNSKAIFTDAMESIINVIASGFAFYSIYLSSLPKDKNHPYGHGKIEFFSAGFEGGLILLAGLFIIYNSLMGLYKPEPLQALNKGLLLVGLTLVINFVLGHVLSKQGKNLQSMTLLADGRHLLADSYNSFILIAGLLIMWKTKWYGMDTLLSLVLALVIIYDGYKLVRKSLAGLMDEADKEILEKIVQLLNNRRNPLWIDVHNLRVLNYGAFLHIDCHLTLPHHLSFTAVHHEIKVLEKLFESAFNENVEVFVHADPDENDTVPIQTWTVENITLNRKHALQQSDNSKNDDANPPL